jgi:signal transduction histidine kinase
MEQQISRQAEALADESRRKDEFLAILSHELRSPLAAICAAMDLLKLEDRDSENLIQRQAREIIERQFANLTKLVGDLLEVSRVVSGKIHLNQATLDLNQVVTHAVETAGPLIEQHRHELVLHLCADPVWVNADATRMEEVLSTS